MKYIIYIIKYLVAGLVLCAFPTFAEAACYTPEQARAEHLLRLHSELMVVAVSCRQGSDGQDLSKTYVSFTQKNIRALHKAEQTLLAYYKTTEKGDPVEALDQLRTRLGNEAGQTAAKMSAPVFCARYRDNIAEFAAKLPKAIEAQTQKMATTTPTFAKACKNSIRPVKGE